MPNGTTFNNLPQSVPFYANEDGTLTLGSRVLNEGTRFDLVRKGTPRDPPWFKVGSGKTNRVGTSMDISDTVLDVASSMPALRLLMTSIKKIDSENIVVMDTANMGSAEHASYKKGIRVLLDKGIFKRVKNRHYMINPSLVLPWENGEALRAKWDSL